MFSRRRFAIAIVVSLLIAPAIERGDAAIPGGTRVVNVATGSYADASGHAFATTSNTLTTTVAAVAALVVGPNDPTCHPATDGFPSGNPLSKTFTITNASNVTDSYTIASATTTAGSIASLAFVTGAGTTAATVGSTASPAVPPLGSIQVTVTLGTIGIPVGTDVITKLVVRTTNTTVANGLQSAPASFCGIAQPGAVISGTSGAGSPVVKHVQNASTAESSTGSVITYQIPFRNTGGVEAHDVVLIDDVPAGVVPDATSVSIDGAPAAGAAHLTGQHLAVALGTVLAGATRTIAFNATLDKSIATGASAVNVASVSGSNFVAVRSKPAAVLNGVANVVYDGYAGSSLPVPGATLTLLDASSMKLVPSVTLNAIGTIVPTHGSQSLANASDIPGVVVPGGPSTGPNTKNANPFVTTTGGRYGFGLSPTQFGAGTYDLIISAPSYLLRRIELKLAGDPTGTFYTVAITARDGQPLANAGAFSLTPKNVSIADVYGLFGNIPLFKPQPVSLTKQVDRSVASAGDRLVYTIAATNGGVTLGAADVVDTLPAGIAYAPGSGRVDDLPVEPKIVGRRLTWSFPEFSVSHTIVFAAVIVPGIGDNTTLTNDATIVAKISNAQNLTVSSAASAATQIVPGVFSNRIVITGRVFADVAGTGRFARGDTGLARVRLFLEDGESVQTDALGRFSFPGVRPGAHVLRLDTTTLPASAKPYDDFRYDSERSVRRLVHGVFDAGVMQDVNFALEVVR